MQSDIAGRIEFKTPDFFRLRMKDVETEINAMTGRTYFIHQGRIVAVLKPREPSHG